MSRTMILVLDGIQSTKVPKEGEGQQHKVSYLRGLEVTLESRGELESPCIGNMAVLSDQHMDGTRVGR